MIVAFMEDRGVSVYESDLEAVVDNELIDVQEGNVEFFSESGEKLVPSEAQSTPPSLFRMFSKRLEYSLVVAANQAGAKNRRTALITNAAYIEPNHRFSSISELRSYLEQQETRASNSANESQREPNQHGA